MKKSYRFSWPFSLILPSRVFAQKTTFAFQISAVRTLSLTFPVATDEMISLVTMSAASYHTLRKIQINTFTPAGLGFSRD